MTIEVKSLGLEEPIAVVIEGECNHADTHFEDEEFDTPNPHGSDRTDEVTLVVCNNCKSYRSTIDPSAPWQGVQVMPMLVGGRT